MKDKSKDIKKTNTIEQITQVAASFKILSDPTRLNIICLLCENRQGLCVNEIAENVGVSQSATSHQLSKLESGGVLDSFREGQTICYSLKKNEFSQNLERVVKILKR